MSALVEICCTCGRRDVPPSDEFDAHMHAHLLAEEYEMVWWIEYSGEDFDTRKRKARAGSVPVSPPEGNRDE